MAEVWYCGSKYSRDPFEVHVVARTSNTVTLSNGGRARIDGDVYTYRPSRKAWFEWLVAISKREFESQRFLFENAKRNLEESQALLERE